MRRFSIKRLAACCPKIKAIRAGALLPTCSNDNYNSTGISSMRRISTSHNRLFRPEGDATGPLSGGGGLDALGSAGADIGDVTNNPVSDIRISDVEGPWLVLTEKLQGEMLIDRNGGVVFRPAGLLGNGVGLITLHESALNVTMFRIDLEVYLYENKPVHPPNGVLRFQVNGMVQEALASKNGYMTRILSGSIVEGSNVSQFNAAKLTPWDASKEQPWTPDRETEDAFRMLYASLPLNITSHLERAKRRAEVESGGSLKEMRGPPFHLNLQHYRVGDIKNVYYIPNYISKAEEDQIMAHLKATPDQFKEKLTKRTAQEWGCTMCPTCSQSFVSDSKMPPWTKSVADMLVYDGVFTPSMFPNSFRIHEYEAGEGIAPHCDGPIYYPHVVILSLASTSVMHFYPRREPHREPMEHYKDTFKFDGEIAQDCPLMSVVMEPGSLLIFADDAYSHYPHGVSDKSVDVLDAKNAGTVVNRRFLSDPDMKEVKRDYRASVTVRNLLPRCSHHPDRAEHFMRSAWSTYNQAEQPEGAGTFSTQSASPGAPPKPTTGARVEQSATAASSPPSPTSPSSPSSSPSAAADAASFQRLQKQLDTLAARQELILNELRDIKISVSASTQENKQFRTEVSQILNYMSSSVINIEADVKSIEDTVFELKPQSE